MTNEERIKADADKYIDQIHCHVGDMEHEAYIAGATAEFERAYHVDMQLKAQDANVEILLNQKKELINIAHALGDALTELVELKRIRDETPLSADYLKRKPMAWEAARKALEQWKSGKRKEVGDE